MLKATIMHYLRALSCSFEGWDWLVSHNSHSLPHPQDGCNIVCRTQGPEEEPPTYRGVSTEPEEEPEERDDHLLPM
ncbi:unnamed protein product [Oncorhynchus mykiss]|uniref:Uncharacterized protein n=1 Tax=Oncorhynchus mykiss TaxID=8022 RepID=A0A060Y046_ONCMY|nr:unnamed protein product [Oncorhynchus mykiss]